MLLSSVILVLQDTLEAALLISVLLVIGKQQWNKVAWLLFGLCGGLVASFLFVHHMAEISGWFDYAGQEIVNASLQISTSLLLVVCTWALFKSRQLEAIHGSSQNNRLTTVFTFCAAGAVALAITREGSEILVCLGVFLQQKDFLPSVVAGSFIGFGIGLSIGILLYYGLLSLSDKWRLCSLVVLMALFAGNMLSQAVLQLTQADLISSTRPVWDTSAWLPENSIPGQLLYALVGYEATPSAVQLIAYGAGVMLALIFGATGKYSKNSRPAAGQVPS